MAKHAGGRPSKFRKEYCNKLIQHMAQGLSFESFAAEIDTTRSTLYEWEKKHPEFSDAHRRGTEKTQIFFEKMGLGLAFGKIKGSTPAWIFFCKNRIGWNDTVVISSSDDDYSYKMPDYLKPDDAAS